MRRFRLLAITSVGLVILGFAVVPGAIATDWHADADGDGCSNLEEVGPLTKAGGQRDPANPWDFYDAVGGDQVINVSDLQDVAFRYGSRLGDPLYRPGSDRSPTSTGIGPPDGEIDMTDVVAVIQQFGSSCRAEPALDQAALSLQCPGGVKTADQLSGEIQAAGEKVKSAMGSKSSASELIAGLAGLQQNSSTFVGAGGTKTDCVELRDADGVLADVGEINTIAQMEPSGNAASGPDGKVYWTCTITKSWKSSVFGTVVARMKHSKTWGYVKDTNNLYYLFLTYNPPPLKQNDSPYSDVDDSPVPTSLWYYQPLMVESNAKTKFKQDWIFASFSTWLESYLIVGPGDSCIGW